MNWEKEVFIYAQEFRRKFGLKFGDGMAENVLDVVVVKN
jgi:hypothetical protein